MIIKVAIRVLCLTALVATGCSVVGPTAGGGTDVSNARVAGVVITGDSSAASGAVVHLAPHDANPLDSSFREVALDTTGADGTFGFQDVSPGQYTMYLSTTGSTHITAIVQNVNVVPGDSIFQKLTPRAPGTLVLGAMSDLLGTSPFHLFIPGTSWHAGPFSASADTTPIRVDSVPSASPLVISLQSGRAIYSTEMNLQPLSTVHIGPSQLDGQNRAADSLAMRVFMRANNMPADLSIFANATGRVSSLFIEGYSLTSAQGLHLLSDLRDLHILSGSITDSVMYEFVEALSGIDSLKSLRVNWAWRNSVTGIPANIASLKSLTVLSIKGGNLDTLPEELCYLSKLEVLELPQNAIRSLPLSMGRLTALRELDLSFNELSTLPQSFFTLPKLTKINLWGNRLTGLSGAELDWLTQRAGDAGIGGQRN